MISSVTFSEVAAISIVSTSIHRSDRNKDAWIGFGLIVATSFSLPFETVLSNKINPTLDGILFNLDRLIGLNTYPLARLCFSDKFMWNLITYSYAALPLMIGIIWILERSQSLIKTAIISCLLAPFIYLIFPAAGPRAAFNNFPFTESNQIFNFITVQSNGPRNAFPSLHFTWALLTYTNSNKIQTKAIAFLFCLLTALATLGSGEHYATDLIGSILLVILVHWIERRIKWSISI